MKEEELCRAPCKPGQETLEETIKIQGKVPNVQMEDFMPVQLAFSVTSEKTNVLSSPNIMIYELRCTVRAVINKQVC